MIDGLHEPFCGSQKKPQTYRKQARQSYLSIAKQKSPKRKKVRKAIRKQWGYVGRISIIWRSCPVHPGLND
ncbi:hypothetical protein HNR44_001866 [Geomicrobium halophilum]|uniref:Transposase n=1 Tax=Geomicrobium halophilum TaxID=549000 RepID=A0A841Q1P7_9BACL|nr:hypothetical protein [Geomicrobium halophilum]MBB6449888.1 hypothetical protein [Geomicrobium halophilum]